MDKYKELLEELAHTLKLDSIDINENNEAFLLFDDSILISFSLDELRNELCLSTTLSAIEPSKQKDAYQKLLEKNLFWSESSGATFCLKGGMPSLIQRLNLSPLDKSKFEGYVEAFVNVTEYWLENIKTL